MDKELIEEMIVYIESSEVIQDEEWGSCRDVEQLINDGDMPELYFRLKNLYTSL